MDDVVVAWCSLVDMAFVDVFGPGILSNLQTLH
jgi:hypothetical protein